MKRNHFNLSWGSVGIALALSAGAPVMRVDAAPIVLPPIYEAALKHNPRCLFRLTAKWTRTSEVASVKAQWYLDGGFMFTTEAPGTGPNAGTFGRSSAVMEAGPSNVSPRDHPWKALVQFYSADGAQLASVWTNVDNARCAT